MKRISFAAIGWMVLGTLLVFAAALLSIPRSSSPAVASLLCMLVTVVVAWRAGFSASVAVALVATLCLDYFGTTSNTGAAADSAVTAGDGLSNLLKYALGLNPLLPAVSPITQSTTSGYLQLSVPKNPAATDVVYTVEVTGDVTNPASWTATGTTVDQNTATLLQVHDNTLASAGAARFIRLQVTRP